MAEFAYLQVTRVCNQKCVFCSNPANGRIIPWEEATGLVDAFAKDGTSGVVLTGGEPTLFPELPRLISYAREKGLFPRMITNGQKTAGFEYLRTLAQAGLEHIHVSVHSHKPKVQAEISQTPKSLANIRRTLDNAGKLGIRVDVNTVINKKNSGHLSDMVRFFTKAFPFLRHIVWNNLDPLMNRASMNPEIVPRLCDFEVELSDAMNYLHSTGRSFRVERVPLCFMSDFPHFSTETRKFVKNEGRRVYFLDEKGMRVQGRMAWTYPKAERCKSCSVDAVCAGLYQMDVYYSSKELCPIFTDPAEVSRLVLGGR